MRIEIAGALSCGKSTLACKLADDGHLIVYEDLTTNPYLDLRMQDPERYDFLCQQQFVLDKIESLKSASVAGRPYVTDFSIAAERAYVSHYVSHRPDWIGTLTALMDASEAGLGQPNLLIHLECAPEAQLDRIAKRGREFEQGHDIPFIANINDRVAKQVERVRNLGVEIASYRTDLQDWDSIIADLYGRHFNRIGFPLPVGGA
jgi:deoxyadenosine/deoxycytidine kinase